MGGGGRGRALQEALIALLGPALQHAGEELEGPLAGLYGYSLRRHAGASDRAILQEPRLSPDMLAGRLRISVRQLYRLFEEQGDSVCRYILRQRLSRSAADLGNPRLRGESITSIAFKWGFSDSAHFSRAFKKQFEVSPKDYPGRRATGLTPPRAAIRPADPRRRRSWPGECLTLHRRHSKNAACQVA